MARKRWHILADLIKREVIREAVEVGVKRGRNVSEILKVCPWCRWHCVDPWDTSMQYQTWNPADFAKHEQRFDSEVLKRWPNKVNKIKAYSSEAAPRFEDGSLDLVFIDATHTYEDCANDIALWLPKLKRGGWMTGHDYHHPRFPGVTEAVDEAFPEGVTECDDTVWMVQC